MRAGTLRRRITIQKKRIDKNTKGEQTVSWEDDATIWGAIWPLRGTEYFASQQIQSSVSHKIRIRYRTLEDDTKITPNCRIKHNTNRYFNIISVIDPDERHIHLDLMCSEEV